VSIVTIAELEMGVLAADDAKERARRRHTLQAAESTEPLAVTRSVAARFAQLVTAMRSSGRARLKVQDAWIAATALDWDAELWTQDADFERVPGLAVGQL
jgi:predicted nucleic acid-binding protein